MRRWIFKVSAEGYCDMGKCIHVFVFTSTKYDKHKRYMERRGDQKDYGRIEMHVPMLR